MKMTVSIFEFMQYLEAISAYNFNDLHINLEYLYSNGMYEIDGVSLLKHVTSAFIPIACFYDNYEAIAKYVETNELTTEDYNVIAMSCAYYGSYKIMHKLENDTVPYFMVALAYSKKNDWIEHVFVHHMRDVQQKAAFSQLLLKRGNFEILEKFVKTGQFADVEPYFILSILHEPRFTHDMLDFYLRFESADYYIQSILEMLEDFAIEEKIYIYIVEYIADKISIALLPQLIETCERLRANNIKQILYREYQNNAGNNGNDNNHD